MLRFWGVGRKELEEPDGYRREIRWACSDLTYKPHHTKRPGLGKEGFHRSCLQTNAGAYFLAAADDILKQQVRLRIPSDLVTCDGPAQLQQK